MGDPKRGCVLLQGSRDNSSLHLRSGAGQRLAHGAVVSSGDWSGGLLLLSLWMFKVYLRTSASDSWCWIKNLWFGGWCRV